MRLPVFSVALCLTVLANAGVTADSAPDPPPSGLRELWVISHQRMKPAEQVLAQTLQGLVGRNQPKIWLRAPSMYAVVEGQLKREGVRLREATSIWEILRQFRSEVKGAILYRLGTPSLNVATSLCGVMDGVAVDESLWQRAQTEGLNLLIDVRGMDERQAFVNAQGLFSRGVLVDQSIAKPGFLRDFAVARRAFTFSTTDPSFRTQVASALGPQAVVYGWGDDEFRWVTALSRAGATGVAADWCLNLSALQALPAGELRRSARPPLETEEGVRYVAFVMSDGDNIQWLCGDFVHNPSYWGSPLRGEFPMTWEVSPLLAAVAPRVLQHLYATAKSTDAFVTGPGVPGYNFLHLQPQPAALAQQAAPLLRMADLQVVTVINANQGNLRETIPLLDLPEVEGVIYKDYAPYHRRRGEIFWHGGKPCVAYRFILWDGLMGPTDVAREVAKMPTAPRTNPGSYALINVHAWSFRTSGGPMQAVRRTLDLLPPGTRVVTADQLIGLLRANLAAR